MEKRDYIASASLALCSMSYGRCRVNIEPYLVDIVDDAILYLLVITSILFDSYSYLGVIRTEVYF